MEYAPQQALDEIKRLQGCINNLISVQALLAIWSGPRAGEIINTLLDALIRVLHLAFACARVKDSLNGPPIEVVRLPLPNSPGPDLQQVRMSAVWLKGD